MTAAIARLFFGGFVRMHILHHAAEAPICGVDITAELRRHGYQLSPGTLYPVLHELEKSGCLKARATVVAGKRRKYYTATARGRAALQQAKIKLRELAAEVIHDQTPAAKRRGEKP
jgi:PadR family transcriptional regulator PadR